MFRIGFVEICKKIAVLEQFWLFCLDSPCFAASVATFFSPKDALGAEMGSGRFFRKHRYYNLVDITISDPHILLLITMITTWWKHKYYYNLVEK